MKAFKCDRCKEFKEGTAAGSVTIHAKSRTPSTRHEAWTGEDWEEERENTGYRARLEVELCLDCLDIAAEVACKASGVPTRR